MIATITGILAETGEKGIVVETGGIGFAVTVPATLLGALPGIGSTVKLYTHFSVSEDAMRLYGFGSRDDRDLFRLILTVSGIGPKAAMGILSFLSADDLRLAILSEDVKTIAKAPGIGPKTAKKLILELKDKMTDEDITGAGRTMPASTTAGLSAGEDAVQALIALGYTASEALNAVRSVGPIEDGMDTQEILSIALRQLV